MADLVLIAYGSKRTASGRNRWTRIGEAYPHDQGAGLTLLLNAMPFDGRVILLEPDAADDQRDAIRAARILARKGKRRAGTS